MRRMRRKKKNRSRPKNEQGVVITLVAVFMLGVIGAMAALSIDVVTLYTARSEAQLAADAAALAGARVLANSGMTSASSTTLGDNAVPLAMAVATQVAASSTVGGRTLNPGASPCVAGQEICVNIVTTGVDFIANPQVTVKVQRTDLPTFFARIWGTTQIKVAASATAEAYNPSSLAGTGGGPGLPIAPMCVKPWLLPNTSPATAGDSIFSAASGAIADPALLGWQSPNGGGPTAYKLRTDCAAPGSANCNPATTAPTTWRYYPGTTDATTGSFPAPSAASCSGCTGFTPYQLSVAGCVQTPISCNSTAIIDQTGAVTDAETATAVNVLTHSNGNGGDSVDTAAGTMPPTGSEPFQFLAGTENPIVLSAGMASQTDVMVSDSLVTVPVIDTTNWPPTATAFPQVQIIGFVQLFLSPTGQQVPASNHIHTQVINLVGCGDGTGAVTGQAILGNGSSAVAVRLIHP
jgi:Putative Flp pilus-assembly TadE/G-like